MVEKLVHPKSKETSMLLLLKDLHVRKNLHEVTKFSCGCDDKFSLAEINHDCSQRAQKQTQR